MRDSEANGSGASCALVRMDGQQMLDFIEKQHEENSLVLPEDYATMGIFNQWSGLRRHGHIELEKDAVLPLSTAWIEMS